MQKVDCLSFSLSQTPSALSALQTFSVWRLSPNSPVYTAGTLIIYRDFEKASAPGIKPLPQSQTFPVKSISMAWRTFQNQGDDWESFSPGKQIQVSGNAAVIQTMWQITIMEAAPLNYFNEDI